MDEIGDFKSKVNNKLKDWFVGLKKPAALIEK